MKNGVYVISKGDLDNIVYIGETTAKTGGLRKRMTNFYRATQDGVSKHSGGRTYNKLFGTDVSDLTVRYHTANSQMDNLEVLCAYIKLAERALIWRFVEEHRRIPVCNYK